MLDSHDGPPEVASSTGQQETPATHPVTVIEATIAEQIAQDLLVCVTDSDRQVAFKDLCQAYEEDPLQHQVCKATWLA